MFCDGQGYAEIGEHFDISRQGAMQLVVRGGTAAHRRQHPKPIDQLPNRLKEALLRDNCPLDPKGVRQHYQNLAELKRVPGFGDKMIGYLQKWLLRHGESGIPD